jgi:hypothetical protein
MGRKTLSLVLGVVLVTSASLWVSAQSARRGYRALGPFRT